MKRSLERRLLTNPVLVLKPRLEELASDPWLWVSKAPRLKALIDDLGDSGVDLPPHFVQQTVAAGIVADTGPSPRLAPGAVGLLWDRDADEGVVAPLKVELLDEGVDGDWEVAEYLPFDASDLQRLFVSLGRELRLPVGVPERLAFRVAHELEEPAEGMSMNVAALLAVLGALAGEPSSPLLESACAVVEPVGSGGQLRASDGVGAKLRGFVREYERGTLLIRHREDDDAREFDEYFDEVWAVVSVKELAEHLQQAHLLDALFERVELSDDEVRRIQRRLDLLVEERHAYAEAKDLSRRALQCEFHAAVSLRSREKIERAWLDAERHQGSMDVLQRERQAMEELREKGRYTCFESMADKAVNYAASCYDPHIFDEIERVLEPWLLKVRDEPRLLSPKLRYKLFNTLANAKVALGKEGWRELFESSLELQMRLKPGEVQRTRNYLIHALLRIGAVEEAREQIALAQRDLELSVFSKRFRDFCRADLARRDGEKWASDVMDPLHEGSDAPGHLGGRYLQATARQPGRGREDRVERFLRARRLFLKDLNLDEAARGNSVLFLLAAAVGMAAAAYGEDQERLLREQQSFKKFIETRTAPECRRYYQDVIEAMGEEPDVKLVERLLSRIPFF